MASPFSARMPPCVLRIRNSGSSRRVGSQPMPAFCDKPKRLPEGWVSSISAVSGSTPAGPVACVSTRRRLASSVSSTELRGMSLMGKSFPESIVVDAARLPIAALVCREASVYGKRNPVDERSFVACKVDQRARDVGSAGQPSEWNLAQSLCLSLRVLEHYLHKGGLHCAGVDRVAADIVFRVAHGHRLGEHGQGALGGCIGLVCELVSYEAADGGHV